MGYQRIIVKLGTSTLTGGTPKLSMARIFDLVRQVVEARQQGHQIVLVSSGAIRAGREALNFPELPGFIPAKQMLAAVGQPRLMSIYDQFFRMFGETVAQVLLNRDDFANRHRFLNARNTMDALLDHGVIPIVNENDTVATEEIRVGDNDNLSAQVANLVEADLLILLTDQAGLFTCDPRQNADARLIPVIKTREIPEEIWKAAGGTATGLGTGGMVTKLQAADMARRTGTLVMIAQGSEENIISRLLADEKIGTRFLPVVNRMESRKRYILVGRRAPGMVYIDQGATEALLQGGSLLPVGVTRVDGKFERGDSVRVVSHTGAEVAVGLVNYSARDLSELSGHHSAEIEQVLGYTFGDEVIHRNNLILL